MWSKSLMKKYIWYVKIETVEIELNDVTNYEMNFIVMIKVFIIYLIYPCIQPL